MPTMTVTVLSLFPDLLKTYFATSILGKLVEDGRLEHRIVDIRDFALDRHRTCDDAPYGGGAGMVIKPEPLAAALDSVLAEGARVVYPTPSGRLFDQSVASELALERELVLICGRYEGIDQRIIDMYVDDELSIGDYVLSSGEVAAMVIVDSVYRLLGGAISTESLAEESFSAGLLEYPQYTRPAEFRGRRVPEVLLSGHHSEIAKWRRSVAREKTARYRSDLLERSESTWM